MHTGLEEAKQGFDRMARYFAERAAGGVSLMVTGGVAPNRQGWVSPFSIRMTHSGHAKKHRLITSAVHNEGGRICMQILHTGRYGYHPLAVAPSAIKAPINRFKPKALSTRGVKGTIADFVRAAKLARDAGYDGVEVMGSEGYLINQFLVTPTNKRTDEWGGDYTNRMRFPVEIVRQIRAALGNDFVIIYRLSMLDLVPGGSSWEEVVQLAHAIEAAGATCINTGIGWHEARVPTIATSVPRAGFAWVTERMMGEVNIPLITTNRINTPEQAEQVLANGSADMVSMARPFLADPEFVSKAQKSLPESINTCIGCNQACLDHIFERKVASCLVNPAACHEEERELRKAAVSLKVAVVGGGPAGMSAAVSAATCGHNVVLFERGPELGGQFNYAKVVPGKEEFYETLRYFKYMLDSLKVTVRLNSNFHPDEDASEAFDHVILASGVKPRPATLPGAELPHVATYAEILSGEKKAGDRVAIVGAGGIGFDVAEFLLYKEHDAPNVEGYLSQWGVDQTLSRRGGLLEKANHIPSDRSIILMQRSAGKPGAGLGKTTGWIHRATLKKAGVRMLASVEYQAIKEDGVHISINGVPEVLPVDTVVICAGQLPENELAVSLAAKGIAHTIVGGAKRAAGLDAKRAIEEGLMAAKSLEL